MIYGFVDGVSLGKVQGWVKSSADDEPLIVTLYIDKVAVESRIASSFRSDVAEATGSSGNFGFTFTIPEQWDDGEWHDVSVRVYGVDQWLTTGGQSKFRLGVGSIERQAFRQKVEALSIGSVLRKGEQKTSRNAPVALFAVFNPTGKLSWSQRRMLEELDSHGFRTILCQSTLLGLESFAQSAAPRCSHMLFRTNLGRDFASWAILASKFEEVIAGAPYVLFANDSFLGPLGSMKDFFATYERDPVDFYGVTDSWDQTYHFQSSLFILSAKAVASKQYRDYWDSYDFPEQRDDIVRKGELAFSTQILKGPLSSRVLAPFEEVAGVWLGNLERYLQEVLSLPEATVSHGSVDDRRFLRQNRAHADYAVNWYISKASNIREGLVVNPQHAFWRELITKYKFPLIKKELVLHNPERGPISWLMNGVVSEHYGEEAAAALSHDARLLGATIPPPLKVS